MVPPPQILQGPKKGGSRLVPRIMQNADGPKIDGLSSTNRILLNKGPGKPGQLPSIGKSGYGTQSQLDTNMRLL